MEMWTIISTLVLVILLIIVFTGIASYLYLTYRDVSKFKSNSKENYDTERDS